MVYMNESFTMLTIRFFKIEAAAFAHGTMMLNAGSSGFRGPFVGINGNLLFCSLNKTFRNGNLIRIRDRSKVGIPYGTFFSQKTVVETALKVIYHSNIRIVRIRRMHHIKGEELISLQNETNVFDGLRITGLFFMTGAEFPLFAQNDLPFFFPFAIPGTEDDKLLIMGSAWKTGNILR